MQKRDMKRAVEERWQVMDDFGAIGHVVGLDLDPRDGEFKLLVLWTGDPKPKLVHYARASRTEFVP